MVILTLQALVVESTCFVLSSVSRNLNIANPVLMLAVIVQIVFTGFMITKNNISKYLVWLYWINPLAWGWRGMAVSQYRSSKFDVCEYNSIDYCNKYGKSYGVFQLESYGIPSEKYWTPMAMVFLLALYILLNIIGSLAL